jgi:hypothetical protein
MAGTPKAKVFPAEDKQQKNVNTEDWKLWKAITSTQPWFSTEKLQLELLVQQSKYLVAHKTSNLTTLQVMQWQATYAKILWLDNHISITTAYEKQIENAC